MTGIGRREAVSTAGRLLPVYPQRQAPATWRSLEEFERTPEFENALKDVDSEAVLAEGFDRRDLFKYMSVSLALAGLTACTRQPLERIVPYVRQPEEVIPGGRPLFFATAMTLGGFATGLLVESHAGRPTKAEGNPQHPASLGATDVFSQASLYDLYDPDRSQTLQFLEEIRPWASFLGAAREAADAEKSTGGAGLRILTGAVSSPTLSSQIAGLMKLFPAAKWVPWEPVSRDNVRAGALQAFGTPVDLVFDLSRADVILSLGSDFLGCSPGNLAMTRQFAARRRPDAAGGMNRLYVVESASTLTGANADHRRPVAPDQIEAVARQIGAALGVGPGRAGSTDRFVSTVASELASRRGRSAVLVGPEQPAAVHAVAHAINSALGNFGQTVTAVEPVEASPADQVAGLRQLAADMDAGRVTTLVILGGNPAYDAPADLGFAERMQKVKLRIHLSRHFDETSVLCQWHIPEAHFLESWSDARAFDGTVSIVQPLIAPLYDGRTGHEVIAAFSGSAGASPYEIVRAYWKSRLPGDFESSWRQALNDGVIAGTASALRAVTARAVPAATPLPPGQPSTGLSIVFRPDSKMYDGRFGNNGWLHEMPDPITRLSWENAALFSPATAERLGIEKEDVVELAYRGRKLLAAAWIEPGLPDDTVVLPLGYGRSRAGRLGSGTGFNAYALRTSDALWGGRGLEVRRTGEKYPLACIQLHQNMEGRGLVRAASLEDFRRNPRFPHEGAEEPSADETLYPDYPSDTYAWAMSVDLSACVGCNACVIACQAENNIPVVGKDQVRRGREMHWLRIDHYYGGEPANPRHFFQPVPCMHCEKAPCELVCPVGATVHSAEGLNDMVYNRCVGTRYCSNNCPYKVRRFNFYHYTTQFRAPSLKMLSNPDVTVRWRGVMEKCTYCVQRINETKIAAEIAGRRVRDGEFTTACAQACPAEAIVFGDIADRGSRVSGLRAQPRSYGLLASLNTRPRTTYLAAVRNPDPALGEPVRTDFPTRTPFEAETGEK